MSAGCRFADGWFRVLGDRLGLEALSDDAEKRFTDAMAYSNQHGVCQAAVAVDSPALALQQEQRGEDGGVASSGRVDAAAVDDWETRALDKVNYGSKSRA